MLGQHIQHYRIVRQLGTGGMGVVYEAEDTRLGRHVALKFLPEGLAVSPEIASSLNHPNICTIYDVGTHEGRRFIAMELVDGESLRSRINSQNGQPLPLDLILDTGCQLADALDAAHAKGLIHRDVKPATVFLTRRNQAKLLDFGIAKIGGEEPLPTPADDLAALGRVLFEMATGRQLVSGQSTDPRLVNPALPEDLARVITRALDKDGKMRFQTARDMLAELGRVRRHASGATGAASRRLEAFSPPPGGDPADVEPGARPRRVRTALVIGGPVAALVLVGGYCAWNATRTPALTERDSLLVADFVNTTGDPVFEDALKQAVSVQLQQSPFLTLLPDQRVQRTLRLLQRSPDDAVTGEVAREICQRAGATATIEGSIAPLDSGFVIALAVHNCRTGAALAEQQTQAASREAVLKELGLAVTAIRGRIGEPLASVQKYDVAITDATTASLEALRAYGLGVRTRATGGDEPSIPFFRQAIDLDANFALAYAKLGVVSGNLGRVDDARALALKAYELRDRVSEYERLYINWNHAARVLQDHLKAKEALELLTAAYPRDFAAHNNLGVYYNGRAEFDKALESYRAAHALGPDEPLPLSNAAYVLLFLGRTDEAYTAAEQALALRPNPGLAIARWTSAVVGRHPRAAEFEEEARKMVPDDQLLSARAGIALWKGQLKAYGALQAEARAKARAANNQDLVLSIEANERIARAMFEGGPAISALKAAAARETNLILLAQSVSVLASMGELAPMRAVLPRLQKEGRNNQAVWLPTVVGQAFLLSADGKPADAIAMIEAALNDVPRAQDLHLMIGRIRQASGDADGAIASYQVVIKAQSYFGLSPTVPMTRLALGELLASRGDGPGAKAQFDALAEQWKDADADFALWKKIRK